MRGIDALRMFVGPLAVCLGSVTSVEGQETHWLVVSGLGGEPEYEELFRDWSVRLGAAVEGSAASLRILADKPSPDHPRIDARARKETVLATVDSIATWSTSGDLVVIVLIGHGSFEQDVSRLNLPGPDMTDTDFAEALEALDERQVVFVNTASASGGFVTALSAPGRAVMTSTKTGGERNQTRFGEFFVAALEGEAADQDKNGSISALEAFQFARRLTLQTYEDDNKLATEHALLDDNGDGRGSEEPSANGEDGPLAQRITLARVSTAATGDMNDPELRALFEQRSALEQQVADLRALRETLDPADYQSRLEALLLEIAQLNRRIQEKGGAR